MKLPLPSLNTNWLIALVALSFLPTLFFYLVGEEGTYAMTSMEMWLRHNWLQEIMYGADNGRPPLVNWLTMLTANVLGWSNIVISIRLVSVAATLGMAAWLYWLCNRLYSDKAFSAFAALCFLSLADLLLYRGWLSYTDPVFALLTFGATATLWVGVNERRRGLLLLSVLLVGGGVLAKAFTAYIFYGSVAFVLMWRSEARRFLLDPRSLLTLALLPVIPLTWLRMVSLAADRDHGAGMLDEIVRKLSVQDPMAYIGHLLQFPAETALRLSPALLLALYLLLRRRLVEPESEPAHFRAAIWIALLGFLPYWLSPQSSIRYLLPLYPVVALVCARIIWRAGVAGRGLALRWFVGIIAVKFLFALVLFPLYQSHYRGKNYQQLAHQVIVRTQGYPLYVTDVRSVGLAVAAYVDIERFPQAPLTFPPENLDSGYVLAMEPSAGNGEIAETYRLAADTLYLLCRGAACKRSDGTQGR